MKVKLADLLPNPYRNLSTYPVDKGKIAALQASIRDTGFWENIVVRKSPPQRGKYEIAYGHHRIIAVLGDRFADRNLGVKGVCKPGDVFDLPCKPLDNATMLRMMAAENMDDWKSDFRVLLEIVRSVIVAAKAGEIGPKQGLRNPTGNIPKVYQIELPGNPQLLSVTPKTIAEFLGKSWISIGKARKPAAREDLALAFRAERLIQDGYLKPKALIGVTKFVDAEEIIGAADDAKREWEASVRQAEKIERHKDATAAHKKAADNTKRRAANLAKGQAQRAATLTKAGLDKGKGRTQARKSAVQEAVSAPTKEHRFRKGLPNASDLMRELAKKVDQMFDVTRGPNTVLVAKLLQLAEFSGQASAGARLRIVSSLQHLVERINSISGAIDKEVWVEANEFKALGLPAPEIKLLEKNRSEKSN